MCKPHEDLSRVAFEALFPPDELAQFLALAGVQFGDPTHDWCPQQARELLEEWRADA